LSTKTYIESILLVILGVITSLSLPPLNFFLINFFSFTCFFLFLNKKTKEHSNIKIFFFYGWLFGFGYFLSNLYWISISLLYEQEFKFLIPFIIILIPAFLALFYGLISFCFIVFKQKNIISSFLIFSLVFGIVEFIRGSILTGFPWNLIAYSFSNQLLFLSITSVIGTYGFNLYCISLFTSPAIFILKKEKKDSVFLILILISVVFFYILGLSNKEKFSQANKETYEYKLRVIASNISLDRFYIDIEPKSVINDLIKISSPQDDEKIIFLWPEGIIPGISKDQLIEYSQLFSENFNKNHLFVIGINSQKEENGSIKLYNSLSVYDHKLNLLDSYNKKNLVPFGEFLPFESTLGKLGFTSITNSRQSFSKGRQRNIIEIKKPEFSLKFIPLICYEIIYSGRLFKNLDFDLIINISEDGWFGQSVGPKQHFVHSIFRAIESGKYVARSSNNGIAAIINPLGIAEKKVNFGESGYIDLKEIKKIQPTVFSKYGNKIFSLLILLYILLIFSFNRIKNE